MHRTVGIGSKRQPGARRLGPDKTGILLRDYVTHRPRQKRGSGAPLRKRGNRRDYRRWRRRFAEVARVAYDFLESDRPRAIEVLCEVVCLEHAIALTGGGEIVAQSEMRKGLYTLEHLLHLAQLEYFKARAPASIEEEPDEAELERLRARCEMLGVEIRRAQLASAGAPFAGVDRGIQPFDWLTVGGDAPFAVGDRVRLGGDDRDFVVTARDERGRIQVRPVTPHRSPEWRREYLGQWRDESTMTLGGADVHLTADPNVPRDRTYVLGPGETWRIDQ